MKNLLSTFCFLFYLMTSAQDQKVSEDKVRNTKIVLRSASPTDPKSQPIYIIDGVMADKKLFSELNPDSIESITVLKNASATAIFGPRGYYGVVVVKMKQKDLTYEQIVKLNPSKPKAKLRDSAFVRKPVAKNPYK